GTPGEGWGEGFPPCPGGLSVYRPSPQIHSPGYGSIESNLSRCRLSVFCTPAFFRFSRIVLVNDPPASILIVNPSAAALLAASFFCSTLIVRCGERLSTVNGPLTRSRP